VGERPVLTQWGFEGESRLARYVPPTATRATARHAAEVGALGVPATEGGLAALWRWLLLLLMLGLLLFLVLRACAKVPPVVVERQQKALDLTPTIATAELESDHLYDELKGLQALRERQLATCVLPPPPAEPPATPPTQTAEVTTPPPPVQPAVVTPPPPTPPAQPALIKPPPPAPPRPITKLPKLPALSLPPLPPIPKAPQIAALPPLTTPTPTITTPRGPSCAPQRLPSEAPEVVMVVDGSGSMGDPYPGAASRIDAAKRSIGQFVAGLPNDIDVGLIEFTGCGEINRDNFYSPPQRPILMGHVNSLQPEAGTPLAMSVARAGRIISSVRPGIIVVVSDGNDTCRGDPCAAAQQIAAYKPNVHVNVIDIGDEPNDAAQCMARATGGHVYQPNTVREMEQMMRQASGQPDVRLCQ
jgi:outer membrane biosynthesis protein TonB